MSDLQIKQTLDRLVIEGDLTRHTIAQFDKKYINKAINKQLTIDLAHATKVDTAGLAWLLTFIELAEAKVCKLSFINLNDDIIKLSKLCGVEALFVA